MAVSETTVGPLDCGEHRDRRFRLAGAARHHRGLPTDKQRTGRPALAGAIVTAGGLLFIGSTDDNRFRAIEAATGKELWTTKLDRRGNANPVTYRGTDGKQYVAIVATDTLAVYALPR